MLPPIIGIALLLAVFAASAMFVPIEQLDRFPQASVRAMAQDSIGYVWFGTNDGLVRFDGFAIDVIRNTPDSQPLPSNEITTLLAHGNQLWVGTMKGLAIYDVVSQEWHAATKVADAAVRALTVFEGTVVAGADSALVYLDDRGRVTELTSLPDTVSALAAGDDTLWIGTTSSGVWKQRGDSGIEPVAAPDDASSVQSLLRDSIGNLWIGLDRPGGFLRILPDGSIERRPGPKLLRSLDEESVRAFFEDEDGGIWLSGYDAPGVYRWDIAAGTVRQMNRHSDVRNVTAYLSDFSHTLWIGTIQGPYFADAAHRRFSHFGAGKVPFAPNEGVVSATFEDHSQRLWVATYPGALYRFDDDGHLWQPVADSRLDTVIALGNAPGNRLWVGTPRELLLFDPESGVVTNEYAGGHLPDRYIPDIRHTSTATWILVDDRLWMFTPDCGFVETPGLGYRMIVHKDRLWLTTESGAHTLLTKQNDCTTALHDVSHIPDSIIYPVTVDRRGSTWFEPESGLGEWTADGDVRLYSESTGLLNNKVYDVLEARDGRLWIPSNGGLSIVDPEADSVVTLTPLDGLGQREFNGETSLVRGDGRLVLGGMNGINLFDPDDTVLDPVAPRVVSAGLRIISPSGENSPLSASVPELTLDSARHGIEAGFSGILFDRPLQVRYRYRLDGYDSQWNESAASERVARYTGLPPGQYALEVMAGSADGIWSDSKLITRFVVPTPWWRTVPALLMFAVVLLTLFYLALRLRTSALTRQKEALEAEVSARTRDLREQKAVVERQNEDLKSLDRAKDAFFENISHEFRTPLTLILGPLRKLREENRLGALDMPIRNAARLLRLISQFLELSRLRAGRMTLTVRRRDLHEQLTSIIDAFEPAFVESGLQLSLSVNGNLEFGYDSQAMELVLSNLLGNALKFTQSGSVKLEATREADSVVVRVEDTGCGISVEQLPNVFERFHTTANGDSQGSGVGLALVKELVELHGGTVEVESTEGVGSRFCVRLPFGIDAPLADEPASGAELEWALPQPAQEPDRRSPTRTKSLEEMGRPELLIVDDEPDMRRYLQRVFNDYQVRIATNGAEALDLATENIPDAIVADVMMPKMNGFELASALRAHRLTCHIPIVLLTARGGRDSRLEGLNRRVDDYVVKPFDEEELRVRLRNLLELRDIIAQGASHATARTGLTGYSGDDVEFIREMHEAILQRCTDPAFRIDDLAQVLGMQKRTLQRKTQQALDKTPSEILRIERLLYAAELLRRGATVTESTFGAGFNSVSHFSRLFSEFFGVNPSDY